NVRDLHVGFNPISLDDTQYSEVHMLEGPQKVLYAWHCSFIYRRGVYKYGLQIQILDRKKTQLGGLPQPAQDKYFFLSLATTSQAEAAAANLSEGLGKDNDDIDIEEDNTIICTTKPSHIKGHVEVLTRFNIYLHQLTPNAIMQLGVFICEG
ncbi:hypothetical protein ACJX0J_030643, partial [Zea mays]